MNAPVPPNEQERLEALRSYGILDTEVEEDFDAITDLLLTSAEHQSL